MMKSLKSAWVIPLLAVLSWNICLGQDDPVVHQMDYSSFVWCRLDLGGNKAIFSGEAPQVENMLKAELERLNAILIGLEADLKGSLGPIFETQGKYFTTINDVERKIVMNISLRNDLSALSQVNFYVYEDSPGGLLDEEKSYLLTVYRNGQVPRHFSKANSQTSLNFHENGLLESAGLVLEGKYYWYKWSPEGRLLKQRISDSP